MFPSLFSRSRFIQYLLVALVFCLPALSANGRSEGKKVKLKGHLVDLQCAAEQKDDLDYLRQKHSRSCFQMPACVKSGYALLTPDDQVFKFDAAGNEMAKKLIADAKKEKDYRITVRGRLTGDQIQVQKLDLDK